MPCGPIGPWGPTGPIGPVSVAPIVPCGPIGSVDESARAGIAGRIPRKRISQEQVTNFLILSMIDIWPLFVFR